MVKHLMDYYARTLPDKQRFVDPYYRDAMEIGLSLAVSRGAKSFVETGVTTRISGLFGHSTPLIARIATHVGGTFQTCDIIPQSQIPPEILRYDVKYTQAKSDAFLATISSPVDFFYLDAGLKDGEAALLEVPHVNRLSHPGTVLVIDDWDSQKRNHNYNGKGHKSIPEYLKTGWRPVLKLYQMLLVRK